MSAFESAYKPMLQGVSQQIARLRLPGQVVEQINMMSDTTTGPRRRPGAQVQAALDFPGENSTSVRSWDTDIGGDKLSVVVGTLTGRWVLLHPRTYAQAGSGSSDYLKASRSSSIRATTVGSEFYFLNTEIKPSATPYDPSVKPPTRRGFMYIKAGAYSKAYEVTVQTSKGSVDLSYQTPNGQNTGDANKTSPEYIASAIANSKTEAELSDIAGIKARVRGAYVYFEGDETITNLAVVSGSGSSFIQCSNTSKVRLESDLPQLLHVQADGYIMTVGEQRSFRYYQYSSATTEWLECGAYGSPRAITGMPAVFVKSGGVWSLKLEDYEGRVAGDDDNNPLPDFLKRGVTGLSTYMNRLVLLSGSQVFMSSSTNPKRFMRSTASSILDNDPIAVGSSANSSAEYQYAVQFQKDLLLFSDKYQALVPSNGQAITPRTATVVITSSYAGDMGSEPIPLGRTVMFPAPKSGSNYGVMEMISSQYSEAQYVANDATAHLPNYMAGESRIGVASTTSSMMVLGGTGAPGTLTVYEYLWDGETKAQQAWHNWSLKHPVASAYFSVGVLHLLFVQDGKLLVTTIDPKAGSAGGNLATFLDLYVPVVVTGGQGQLPEWFSSFYSAGELVLVDAEGAAKGTEVGVASVTSGGLFSTVAGYEGTKVYAGVRFRSTLIPTQPSYVDRNGAQVDSAKMTLLRFGVMTRNSREYEVKVTDIQSSDPVTQAGPTLYYSSVELVPGSGMYPAESRAVIPARVNAATVQLEMFTEGTGELNVVALDFVGRIKTKVRRV